MSESKLRLLKSGSRLPASAGYAEIGNRTAERIFFLLGGLTVAGALVAGLIGIASYLHF